MKNFLYSSYFRSFCVDEIKIPKHYYKLYLYVHLGNKIEFYWVKDHCCRGQDKIVGVKVNTIVKHEQYVTKYYPVILQRSIDVRAQIYVVNKLIIVNYVSDTSETMINVCKTIDRWF